MGALLRNRAGRASRLGHAATIACAALIVSGCRIDNGPDRIRECRTKTGETFQYWQSRREGLAEDMPMVVNRRGVRDTNGWWRGADTITSCRDLPKTRGEP